MHLGPRSCAAHATLEMIDPLLTSLLRHFSKYFALLRGNANSCWIYVLTALNSASGDNLFFLLINACQSDMADCLGSTREDQITQWAATMGETAGAPFSLAVI